MENKHLIIVPILLLFLSIFSRNLIFLVLALVSLILLEPNLIMKLFRGKLNFFNLFKKQSNNNYSIENGILTINGVFKAFLIVDDIPFDYRDFTNESLRSKIVSFHKVLDIVNNVDIIFQKKGLDKNKFLENLFRKAQNLRVIIESDPSNEKAKNELSLVQEMIKRISEGEPPFQYVVYFIITAESREESLAEANLLRKGLESIGIKARLASRYEIEEYLDRGVIRAKEKIGFPTQVPYLTTFSFPKSPNYRLISEGIYLGREIESSRPIFWNLNTTMNPHTLVIGPTGSGKTEFLISTGVKINTLYQIPVLFFDVKNDIKLRLKNYGIKPIVLNPLLYSLDLLSAENKANYGIYASQIENIITNSFRLDKYSSSILYKVILDALHKYQHPSWDNIIELINELDITDEFKIYLAKIINKIKSIDIESKGSSLVEKINDSIYVIDLSLIKSEELRRFVIYSILIKILDKYNIADDKLKISLVIDEAWTILKSENENYSLVADIIKRGRGYGIMLMMATQNIYDLGELSDIFLENSGLLLFMNNGDKKFWEEMKRFANISEDEIYRQLTFLGRGEAVIRFIGDPRSLVIKLDTLTNA
ncbi:DNA import protein CedB [Stygiolobus caldivivus]|uniref:AAA ATPase n=1 Tax=Stygiolobus caldivivus TaxID=2824673 RepID=A0A8D5U7Q9_9CREN|nr:DNA import protein CedB [Stygiolobus caldivivus]BCU70522.1 hypothetical protein KN1_18190 [Stygiolobus caldivivus]